MRTNGMRTMTGPLTGLLLLATLALLADVAQAQPLRRSLADYAILAMRKATLKDIVVTGPCNAGVNCAGPGDCGTMSLDKVNFAPGSQIAADEAFFTKNGAIVWQLFRNNSSSLDNVDVLGGPVQPFTPPILPGTCSAACVPDVAAIQALCGFPSPFPACDPAKSITADNREDCSAFDTVPGNDRCDLGPGTYGALEVRNGATVQIATGGYVFCRVNIARSARVIGTGVTLDLPAGGVFRVGSSSQLGQACGDFVVHVDGASSTVAFGRNALIAAQVCAPETQISIGHNNVLIGQFVGDIVSGNFNNEVRCCGRCTCIDEFTPTTADVGEEVTLSSGCDLLPTTAVRVCGIDAQIVSKTTSQIVIRVPAGAAGNCPIQVVSPVGDFVHKTPLAVN